MTDLDNRVGLENFPEPPPPDFSIVIKAFSQGSGKAFAQIGTQIGTQMAQLAEALAKSQIKTQKDYTLWPPALDSLQRQAKRTSKSDSHIPPKYPVFHNRPDFERREAIAAMRSKQLSRPIGSQGCGFVWNRGRIRT